MLTLEQEAKARAGLDRYIAELSRLASERGQTLSSVVYGAAEATGREQYEELLATLAQGQFANALAELIQEEDEPAGETDRLFAAGATKLGPYVIRAFRKRICADPGASEEVRKAIEAAEKAGAKITTPTSTQLAVGAASVVSVAIGSLFAGPIAVALSPLIGGLTLLLIQSGVDAFCDYTRESGSVQPAAPS